MEKWNTFFVLIAVFCVGTYAAPSATTNVTSDQHFVAYLNKVITLFRQSMTKGIPPLKVPITEPLVIPTINLNEQEGAVRLKGSVSGMTITHLSEFQVPKLEANLKQLYLSIVVTVPRFEVNGNYEINGVIGGILPIEGSSTFYASGHNITVGARLKLKHVGDKIQCSDFNIDIDLSSQDFKLEIHKLYDDPSLSKVISEVLSDGSVKLYKHYKKDASDKLRSIVLSALNSELAKHSFKDIILGKVTPVPFKLGD